jgi:hypothetical protein
MRVWVDDDQEEGTASIWISDPGPGGGVNCRRIRTAEELEEFVKGVRERLTAKV